MISLRTLELLDGKELVKMRKRKLRGYRRQAIKR
jgi:hypothetical protein